MHKRPITRWNPYKRWQNRKTVPILTGAQTDL